MCVFKHACEGPFKCFHLQAGQVFGKIIIVTLSLSILLHPSTGLQCLTDPMLKLADIMWKIICLDETLLVTKTKSVLVHYFHNVAIAKTLLADIFIVIRFS